MHHTQETETSVGNQKFFIYTSKETTLKRSFLAIFNLN